MPLYVYECPRCNVTTERSRKVDDRNKDLPECPECHHAMPLAVTAPQGSFPGADSWRSR